MGKLSKDRRDIYYRKAKESGYRARSSFKLIQINEKFEVLKLFYPNIYIDNINIENAKETKLKTLDKLISIYNEQFCYKIVDLCAAPGSWSQVLKNICLFNYFQILNLVKHNKDIKNKEITYVEDDFVKTFSLYINQNEKLEFKVESLEKDDRVEEPKIIAVDLQEMGNMKHVNIIQGDITKISTIEQILHYMEGKTVQEEKEEKEKEKEEETVQENGKEIEKEKEKEKENNARRRQFNYADIVVSDGAPDITGMNDVDEFIQSQLILSSLKVCCSVLKVGGNFISKIFRGEHTGLLIMHLNNFFEKVYICKPQSSRHKSLEAFLVCLKFSLPLSNIVGLNNNQKKKVWEKGKFTQDELRNIHTRFITKKDYYKKGTGKSSDKDESESDSESEVDNENEYENKSENEDDMNFLEEEEEEEEEEEGKGKGEGEEGKKNNRNIAAANMSYDDNKQKEGNEEEEEEEEKENGKMDIFNFYYSDSDEEIKYFNSEDEEVVNNYISSQNFNNDKFLSFVATQNYYDSDKSYLLPTNYVRREPQLMPLKPPYLLSLQKKRQKIKKTETRTD